MEVNLSVHGTQILLDTPPTHFQGDQSFYCEMWFNEHIGKLSLYSWSFTYLLLYYYCSLSNINEALHVCVYVNRPFSQYAEFGLKETYETLVYCIFFSLPAQPQTLASLVFLSLPAQPQTLVSYSFLSS